MELYVNSTKEPARKKTFLHKYHVKENTLGSLGVPKLAKNREV